MYTFTYESQGINTYLVYEIQPNDTIDSMSLGMLTNNKITGLAQTIFTQMDTQKYIKYNVSAKISAKQFFSGAVNKKRLLGVFNSIVNSLLSTEDYMIESNTIVLDMDYIFTDVSTCEACLICLPITNESSNSIDLGAFFKQIMFSTQFDQSENCDHVTKILNFLNSSPLLSLLEFKNLLNSLNNNVVISKVQTVQQANAGPLYQTKTTPVATSSKSHIPVAQPVAPIQIAKQPNNPSVGKQSIPHPPVSQDNQPQNEQKISFFKLLTHYSKENAELYKAQKAEKKVQTATDLKPSTPIKQPPTSFSIPGSPNTNSGFAIPGQPTLSAQPIPQPIQQPVKASNVHTTSQKAVPSLQSATPSSNTPVVSQIQPMSFGETTVLGGGIIGETTVLNGSQQQEQKVAPQLIRFKNNEKILLNKPVYRIGKERSYVDYFIGDNTAISRSHANFITRDNNYFVVDTNSTNHTFVNGTMIQSNVETQISHGDKIRLANEDFKFEIY